MEAIDDQAREEGLGFRLSAKNLFLTYPRCAVDAEMAEEILLGIFGRANVLYMCIARESHEDGTPHLHCVVLLHDRCNLRDQRALDIFDHHGNYQAIRNVKQTLRYVKKDGEYREYGELPTKYADGDDLKSILEKVSTLSCERELMEFIFCNKLSSQHMVLTRYWQSVQASKGGSPRFTVETFTPSEQLMTALQGLGASDKALLLTGPTGIGKTQFLLSYFSAKNVVRATHMDDLKKVSTMTNLLIMDDMEFGHHSRASILHLFDIRTERSIHCRFSCARLPPTLDIIVVCNSIELAFGIHSEDPAVRRRLDIIELTDKLF